MEHQIIERYKEDANEIFSHNPPLTYRVSISLENNKIVLLREYFYVGYNDGEKFDDFYMDSSYMFTRMSYLTRDFNKDYLKKVEKELIDKFYFELLNQEVKLNEELKNETEKFNRNIAWYKKYENCDLFIKTKRRSKLKEINKK